MNQKVKELITIFGNQQKTAKALGCSQTTVFKWLHSKMHVSAFYAVKAERLTNGEIKAVDLCSRLKELDNL